MITLQEVRARFARDHGLPVANSLSEQNILNALNEHGIKSRDRVFTPVTTIWGFLSQVLSDDHSCNARGRVITGVLRSLARQTATELQAAAAEPWKWNGRNVFIADGTHVSMPDTAENQASYPQPPT